MNLSPAILTILLALATIASAQVPTHTWQVETAQRPAPYALELIRGESIILAPQYVSNGVAITFPGSATAALRYRSADMAADTYYSIAGTVTGSTARFSWASTHCAPATNYTYTIALTGTGVNLRSYGTIKLIGVVSGTQTSAPTLYAPYPWETTLPILSNSFLGNGSATINGATLTNGAAITISGAGLGDMTAAMYDPDNIQRGVIFTNDARYLAALTNASAFATATQGAKADTALQPADTNGWVVSSHVGLVATNDVRYLAALTNASAFATAAQGAKADTSLQPADTNGWVVSSHAGLATNAGGSGSGYYAMSNGVWTVFVPSSGGTDNALTNGGATLVAGTDISLSSTSLTNGAAITISYTGGGSTGGISAATASNIVAGIMSTGHVATAETVTGSQSNLIATALQPTDTNGWTVSSHIGLVATNDARYLAGLTNAAAFDAAGTAADATNGLDADFIASKGGVTNGGATINGAPITNGAAFTITGGGGTSTSTVSMVIDAGGSVIPTGSKGYLYIPYPCTINAATMIADRTGSIVVDVWKCTYAEFDSGTTHPVAADKITASAPPTITSDTKSTDTSLTGWTTSVSEGDILAFNVTSATAITRVTLILTVTK